MIDTAEMKDLVQSLLTSQRLAVLSTQISGRPYSNLIAFAATEDLKYIFFATGRATRKYANLTAEPWVSLLIDSGPTAQVRLLPLSPGMVFAKLQVGGVFRHHFSV